MGLDINVCRILKERPAGKNNGHYFRMIDEDGDDGSYSRRGFPDWTKQYEQEITETWFDWDKYKADTGFDIMDWNVHMERLGNDGYMEVYPKSCVPPTYDENHPEEYDNFWDNLETKRIYYKDVPKKKVQVKVLFYEHVGYQRRGLNARFYEDYMDGKIGYFVWTKKELLRYVKDYCDKKTKTNGGPKRQFKENIIDSFVEGQDVVTFSW